MDGQHTELIRALFRMARNDPEYAIMHGKYDEVEEQFSNMVMELPQQSQDLAWAFVCLSEEMNWRMLEIICEKMQIWRADVE